MAAEGNPRHPPDTSPQVVLLRMLTGYWVSQSIYVAAKLGIADLLKDGPKRCTEMAEAIGADRWSLYRLMRGLASVGIFSEIEEDRFGLTPLAALLETSAPDSMRALAILYGEEQYRAWAHLLQSVKTGESAFPHVVGKRFFEYLAQNPEAGETFNRAMTAWTEQVCEAVLAAYDFSGFKKIVDVGGGHGMLITSILRANPNLRGILFDTPPVIEGADKHIAAAGLAGQCQLVAGDFFESVPIGGDIYILSSVIHDWDDERSIHILTNCRHAMAKRARILLVEQVIPPGNEPFFGKLLDLHMLVITEGHERTEAEYRKLFDAAGLKLTKVIQTRCPESVIEGICA